MKSLTIATDKRGLTTLTLDRAERHNALDRELIDELSASLDSINSHTRLLLLKANGKHFCAGADIRWMQQSQALTARQNKDDALALSSMLDKLNTLPCPTIARVQGAAMGGGTGLACCCDIVIASDNAMFAFSEVRLGIIPATIAPYAIDAIGARNARRYFLTAERIDAQHSVRLGITHQVCSDSELDSSVDALVDDLLRGGPQAQIAAKQLIRDVQNKPVDPVLREQLAGRLAQIRTGEEAQEGLEAFLTKRSPGWSET